MTTEQNVSPAQELRAAASKIREIAAKATEGPWSGYVMDRGEGRIFAGPYQDGYLTGEVMAFEGEGCDYCHSPSPEDVAQIEAWDPLTAVAVSDLLDAVAADMEANAEVPGYGWDPALNVARALFGGPR